MRPRRVDANHTDIVSHLRSLGASVFSTAPLGRGFPDVAVGFGGLTMLAEIKDGSKPPSAQRLTPDEQKFRDNWKGGVYLIRNKDDATRMVGTMQRFLATLRASVMDPYEITDIGIRDQEPA